MKKLFKIGMLLFMGAAFAGMMTSCDDEYPKPGDTPVVAETHNISGMITNRSGEGLEGVEVTLNNGEKATTNASGYFVFPDVKVGEYTLTAAKEGYIEASTKVKISNDAEGMNAVWNVMLLSVDVAKSYTVSTVTATTLNGAMETGNIKGNDNGSVNVSVVVPENAFVGTNSNEVNITITPNYNEEQAKASRADDKVMFVGATISCSDPNVKLADGKTISLVFDVDNAADLVEARQYDHAKNAFVKYDNVAVTSRAGNTFTIFANKINTSYGLFAGVTFDKKVTEKALTFNPDVVDNLNGNKSIRINTCAYQFGVGTNISVDRGANNKVIALLIETLAQRYGSNAMTIDAKYPVNINLPVGSYFRIWGTQDIANITATCQGMTATATSYGNVKIDTKITHKADHNGGSN